jgi:hypothetical protein
MLGGLDELAAGSLFSVVVGFSVWKRFASMFVSWRWHPHWPPPVRINPAM